MDVSVKGLDDGEVIIKLSKKWLLVKMPCHFHQDGNICSKTNNVCNNMTIITLTRKGAARRPQLHR